MKILYPPIHALGNNQVFCIRFGYEADDFYFVSCKLKFYWRSEKLCGLILVVNLILIKNNSIRDFTTRRSANAKLNFRGSHPVITVNILSDIKIICIGLHWRPPRLIRKLRLKAGVQVHINTNTKYYTQL